MIEASKMPLPEADKKLKLKTAFSGAALATTGGTRRTSLSRPRIGIFGAAIPSRNPFVCGKPHTKTTMLRIIHGSQARKRSPRRLGGTESEDRERDWFSSLLLSSFF